MGRPKKRTGRPGSLDVNSGQFHSKLPAYYRASKNHFPNDDLLVFHIAHALLTRISQYSKYQARQVYHKIQLLMIAEQTWKHQRPSSVQLRKPDMELDEWMAYYGDHLYDIAFTKSRGTHWPPVFNIQRVLLEEALRGSDYPEQAHDTTQLDWLREHGRRLDDVLIKIPCWCVYHSVAEIEKRTFMEIEKKFMEIEKKKKKKKNPSESIKQRVSINQLVTALLAELHGTTIKNVIGKAKPKYGTIATDGLPVGASGRAPVSKYSLDAIEKALNPPFPPFDYDA